MAGFTKLDSGIVDSSIWSEPLATRVVWITFLAKMDENGMVSASWPGMVRACNVTETEFSDAVKCLESPDAHSRTKTAGGRRIQKVDGGWIVLNQPKYRTHSDIIKEQTRLRVQRFRQSKSPHVTQRNVTETLPSASASASASASEGGVQRGNAHPPSSEHAAFIKGWVENYKAKWGIDYKVDGGRDGKAVKALLKLGILRIDLLEIAKQAWERDSFDCRQARTIYGFENRFNQIHLEVRNGKANSQGRRENPRNFGVTTNIEEQKRLIAAKLARDAAAQKARSSALAEEMAGLGNPPSGDSGGGG